jgi:hypothetical protein
MSRRASASLVALITLAVVARFVVRGRDRWQLPWSFDAAVLAFRAYMKTIVGRVWIGHIYFLILR